MRQVFYDTSYLKATIDRQDQFHSTAKVVGAALGEHIAVTSQMVLTEFLNFLAERGEQGRRAAIQLVEALTHHPNAHVVAQTTEQFEEALALYGSRIDKGYSLTDCASMLIMQEGDISEILTADKHFQQAGFKALLRPAK